MHLHQIHVLQSEACSLEGNRRRKHRRLKQLLTRIERGIGVRPDYPKRRVAERLRLFLVHQ